MAEAMYGNVPEYQKDECCRRLEPDMGKVFEHFARHLAGKK